MKTTNFKIQDGENNLTVEIETMDAFDAEEWLMRAGLIVGRELAGIKGTNALFSALSSVDYEKAKPLLNELLACCYLVEGNMKTRITPEACRGRISNPTTILRLRMEAAKLNFGFLFNGVRLNSHTAETSESPAKK